MRRWERRRGEAGAGSPSPSRRRAAPIAGSPRPIAWRPTCRSPSGRCPTILALADPPPATLEAGFVLCSTHRTASSRPRRRSGRKAIRATSAPRTGASACASSGPTRRASPALEREMTTMCRIAAAHRIAYRHWQTEVAGKSVRLAGDADDRRQRRISTNPHRGRGGSGRSPQVARLSLRRLLGVIAVVSIRISGASGAS